MECPLSAVAYRRRSGTAVRCSKPSRRWSHIDLHSGGARAGPTGAGAREPAGSTFKEIDMNTRHTLIRAAGLALAIAAAYPALSLADTIVSTQGSTRNYVYYRDHDIYYAPDTRTYYWRAGGSWHWGDTLPDALRGDIDRGGIDIALDTDRPYERHDYVVSRYKNNTARRHYVYYRDHDIYYAPESRTYYWMADGTWRSGDVLPERSRGYVTSGGIEIDLDTDRPYERHDYVVSTYKNRPGTLPAAGTVSERSVNRDGSVTTTT